MSTQVTTALTLNARLKVAFEKKLLQRTAHVETVYVGGLCNIFRGVFLLGTGDSARVRDVFPKSNSKHPLLLSLA